MTREMLAIQARTHLTQFQRMQRLEREEEAARRANRREVRDSKRSQLRSERANVATAVPHLGRLYLRATEIADHDAVFAEWRKAVLADPEAPRKALGDLWAWFRQWGEVPQADLELLPTGSALIQFRFRLIKPYLSQDDEALYILDNPVRKDKVFKLPMVGSTSWKGSLRSVMRLKEGWTDERPEMIRLFGNPKGSQENFCAGRLFFFPTFFTQIGLEVINPHDRSTGAGTMPIYFECVPREAEGIFTLLYVPFDIIGEPEDEMRPEVADDLKAVAEAVEAMFTVYGFGAKTSSGFGVADASFPPPEGQKYGGLIQVKGMDRYHVGGFEGLQQAVEALRKKMVPPEGEA